MTLYNPNSPDVGMAVGEPDVCWLKFCCQISGQSMQHIGYWGREEEKEPSVTPEREPQEGRGSRAGQEPWGGSSLPAGHKLSSDWPLLGCLDVGVWRSKTRNTQWFQDHWWRSCNTSTAPQLLLNRPGGEMVLSNAISTVKNELWNSITADESRRIRRCICTASDYYLCTMQPWSYINM